MADRADPPAGSSAAGNQDDRWVPPVAACTDVESAGADLRLFRSEVLEARQTQWLSERRASMTAERSQQHRLLVQQGRALANRVAAVRSEEQQIEREIGLLHERVEIAAHNETLHRRQYEEGFISEMRLQQVHA